MHRLTQLALGRPKTTIAILSVITVGLGLGLPHVESAYGYRVVIGDDHPAIRTLDSFTEQFSGGLPVHIAWECGPGFPCSSPFDERSIEVARAIEESLARASGVRSVVGPASAPLLMPIEGGFAVRRFVEHGARAKDAAELEARARDDPMWVGSIVSKDGVAVAVVVQPADSREKTGAALALAIDQALAPHTAQGFRFHVIGDAIESLIVGEDLALSMARLIPFTVLLIGVVLYLLCRSLTHTLAALATMGVALLWTFGVLGWLGLPRDGILEILAPLILVVGVCDAVHLLSRIRADSPDAPARTRGDRAARVIDAARDVSPACVVTSLTTAVAFLSFVTSDLATFIRFGSISAFGVLACLFLTFTLLPMLAAALPAPAETLTRTSTAWRVALEAALSTSERRAVPLLLVSLLVLVFCGVGWIGFLRVDTNWVETLGEHSRVVKAQRFMEEHFGQTSSLEVEIELPEGTPLEAPETLREVAAVSDFLTGLDGIDKTTSILDLIGRVNRLLHDDLAEFDRPGDTATANAEMLELIGFDDPELISRWVSFDRSRVRISATAPEQPTSMRGRILTAARDYVEQRLPAGFAHRITGRIAIHFQWIRDVQATQLSSFPTALVLVFAMVAIFLRSIRLAVAAMVPTILPIAVTLGAMGWVGMTLDVSRSMIAAILLGIAVDDSIHILRFYDERRRCGDDPVAAIRAAVLHTGRAVITTSLALSLGFLTLMASAWQSIASFGFFVAIAILGALAASLFVLPALIFAFAGKTPRSERGRRERDGDDDGAAMSERARRIAGAAALLPLSACLVAAGALAVRGDARWELPCWILPSGYVLTAPGFEACPLQLLDEVRWVEGEDEQRLNVSGAAPLVIAEAARKLGSSLRLGVARRGKLELVSAELQRSTRLTRLTRLSIVGLIASVLMAMPVFLLWHSRSAAALPLAILYSATGVVFLAATVGRPSSWMSRLAVLALIAAPAALVHLSLVFPEADRTARKAPVLLVVPYLGSALLAAVAALTLGQNPVLWPTFIYLQLALCGASWAVLMFSCAYASRESTSPFHRARARFVLLGSLLLPAAVAAPVVWRSGPAEAAATFLWASALLMPLPIAFAVSRYNLFDLEWHARRAIALLLYCAGGALAAAVLVYAALGALEPSASARDPALLFATAFGCLLIAEAMRRRTLGFLEARFVPRSAELRRLRDESAREMGELRDAGEITRHLATILQRGLAPRSGSLLLYQAGQLYPVAAFSGEAMPDRTLVRALSTAADGFAATDDVIQMAIQADSGCEPHEHLIDAGIEVIAFVRHRGDLLGLVVLGEDDRRGPYSAAELDFLRDTLAHAAMALHNAQLADELAAIERSATTERVAVDLMHDVGKDLGWIRQLVKRLAADSDHDAKLAQGVAQVRDLTESVIRRMRAFVLDATTPSNDPPGIVRLEELLERSLRAARSQYGPERLRLSNDPTIRGVRCHENVGRALSNLVDDGFRAAGAYDSLPVSASVDGDWLQITVGDRDGSRKLAASDARMGIGTETSRNIVEALGGRLRLTTNARSGTCATFRIPIGRPA